MDEQQIQPINVQRLSDLMLFRTETEYRQAYAMLRSGHSTMAVKVRDELESVLIEIDKELRDRGIRP